jgi:membrane protease YdiL (CAAX protease family)
MRLLLPNATPASLALPIVAGATRLLDRITAAALAVVIAPLVEETLFRGIFYGALRSRMRPVLAMAVSGAVFGLVHLDLVAAVPLTALGMILAYLYERTGSLTAPAVAHGLVNAAAVALTLVM